MVIRLKPRQTSRKTKNKTFKKERGIFLPLFLIWYNQNMDKIMVIAMAAASLMILSRFA